MESSDNECPTEILIDFKEEDFLPSYLNYKTPSQNQKAMKCTQSKGNDCDLKKEKSQGIMDMSPFKLTNECNKRDTSTLANSEQVLDEVNYDCPTALLIDIPSSSRTCPKEHSLLACNKKDFPLEETFGKHKILNDDVNVKEYDCIGENKYSAIEDSDNPCSVSTVKNELSPPRLRWRTPSPQSMCRITREASKVIHNLNSSAHLDEDSLLCEEILPFSINFDLDENSDEETLVTSVENCNVEGLSNQTSSVCMQTDEDAISTKISKIDLDSSSVIQEAHISPKDSSVFQSPLAKFDSNIQGKEDSNKCSISESVDSLEMLSSSLNNEFISNEVTNDVFCDNNLSKDKENKQERKEEKVLPSETIIKDKAIQKIFGSVKEIEKRPTLRILSNVNSKYLPSIKKVNSTSNYTFKPHSKELQSQGKQQLKKATSAEPQMPKGISRSNSFQYDNKRDLVFSFPQPKSVKQKPSLLSSSSVVKPSFAQMNTPNRKYSVATPLRSSSVKKSKFASALPRAQNPPIPRFTPQSASGRRISFSKSWQPLDKSNSKGFKNQNIIHTSSAEKPSFCGTYSCKPNKQILNKSISLSSQVSKNNSLSTTSKKRFCSKLNLPSPLPAEQDRKLARALFPSNTSKDS